MHTAPHTYIGDTTEWKYFIGHYIAILGELDTYIYCMVRMLM